MLCRICILTVLPAIFGFQIISPSNHRNSRGGVTSLTAGIDVSGLTFIPIPEEFNFDAVSSSSSSGNGILTDLSNALIIAGGLAYFAYERRPRGSARDDLIEIRKSKTPGGNLGVFSKKYIAEGTELGSFPGYLVSSEDALATKTDDKARASAKKYFFVVGDEEGEVIDPTNKAGQLELEITFLAGLVKVDTMLARVNEAPKGSTINLFTRINGPDATVVADRDIFPDEELFMDCGRYDWTNYEKEQEEVDAQRLSKIRLEEEEMMTLRPITSDKTGGKIINEQDTSLPDGFLRKLALQDEKKFKKVGILSPEEGAGMFADLGNNMFGNKEDRDLIESIQGKDNSDRSSSQSSGGNRGKGSNMVDSFSREGDDEDLLDSLKRQLGSENLADFKNIPDITNPTGEGPKIPIPTPSKKGTSAPAPPPSIFDTRAEKKDTVKKDIPLSSPSLKDPNLTAVIPSVENQNKKGGDVFETQSYSSVSTSKETEDLEDDLNDMTDDEVANVLSKLRAAVSDRTKE